MKRIFKLIISTWPRGWSYLNYGDVVSAKIVKAEEVEIKRRIGWRRLKLWWSN